MSQKRFNEKSYDKTRIRKGAGIAGRQKVRTPSRNMDSLIQVQQIGQGSSQRNLLEHDESDVVYF